MEEKIITKVETKGENLSSETQRPADKDQVESVLTEEQLACYEEYLKNSDWGHQPC